MLDLILILLYNAPTHLGKEPWIYSISLLHLILLLKKPRTTLVHFTQNHLFNLQVILQL